MKKIIFIVLTIILSSMPTFAIECKNSDECYVVGMKMFSQQDYKTAVDCYTMALKLSSDDYDKSVYYTFRAKSNFYLNNFHSMLEDTDAAIELRPNARAYGLRGSAKLALGDHYGAIEDATEALKLDETYMKCYEVRGRAENHLGYYVEALKDAGKAISYRNDYPKSYEVLAMAQMGLRDYRSAAESFEKAADLFAQKGDRKSAKLMKKQIKVCRKHFKL